MRLRSKLKGNGLIYKQDDTLDFMLSEQRNKESATTFFTQAINQNGFLDKVVMDKSGANYAGLANINLLLILAGYVTLIDICQLKYLNNIIDKIIFLSRK